MSKSMAMRLVVVCSIFVGGFAESPVHAQETTKYTYDALGRLTVVVHSGGPSDGVTAKYQYDSASNRTNVSVTGSPNGNASSSNSDNGASVPSTVYVVVPLNGFTVIPINQ